MKLIKWASDIIAGNIREAQRYIDKAYELRETSPMAAEWCRDMANAHLQFNGKGHDYVRRLIAQAEASGEHHELMPGMKAVYNEVHNDLIRQAAEVRSMIDTFE